MKCKRLMCIFLFTFVLLLSFPMRVLALNIGFETKPVSEKEEKEFTKNIAIELFKVEPKKKPIVCFHVNSQGMIAIGTDHIFKKMVAVYNQFGQFQYAYRFNSSGSIDVDWDEDNVVIYFNRSDMAVEVDANGKVLNVAEVLHTADNSVYRHEHLIPNKKIVGDIQYYGKNEGLSLIVTDYAMLVSKDAQGKETVIYDASTERISADVWSYVGSVAFFGGAAFFAFRKIYKQRNSEKKDGSA